MCLIAAGGLYAGYLLVRTLWWNYKNRQLKARARQVIEARNAKKYEFPRVESVDEILKADIAGLRKGLIEGAWTSVDLVNVFA
jgi:hypothetical protein